MGGTVTRETRASRASTVRPEVLLLAAMTSVQFGSACADKVFPHVGPAGVALLRVAITAVVLLVVARPSLRGRTRHDVGLVALYGIFLAGMNWSFYEALHRLPLGVAVTIEFSGPLAVAVAGSRRARDVLWVLLAGGGVVLLALRGDESGVSTLGVVLALVAASCWAVYILLAKRVGSRYGALDALALGMVFGTVLVLPAGIVEGGSRLGHPGVIAASAGVALLSSLIPYTLELVALRRLATHVFGLLMSLEPAVAAIAGVIVLGQSITLTLGVALVLVIAASVGVTLTSRTPPPAADVPELRTDE